MDEREADIRYDRLVENLESLRELLAGDDAGQFWADWLAESRRQILAHDGWGLTHLLGAYGGMGSFNDLQLPGSMSQLRTQIYDDAAALKADLDS